MKLEDIKVGDTLIPRRFVETDELSFLPDMLQFCDAPHIVEEVDEYDGTVSFVGCYVDGVPRWWPVAHVDSVSSARSSPAQRLAKVKRMVGRLLVGVDSVSRFRQLRDRMRRAQAAAAKLERGS